MTVFIDAKLDQLEEELQSTQVLPNDVIARPWSLSYPDGFAVTVWDGSTLVQVLKLHKSKWYDRVPWLHLGSVVCGLIIVARLAAIW